MLALPLPLALALMSQLALKNFDHLSLITYHCPKKVVKQITEKESDRRSGHRIKNFFQRTLGFRDIGFCLNDDEMRFKALTTVLYP